MAHSPRTETQSSQSEETARQVLEGYESFYKHIAYRPELARFRKFGAFWAKKLHDDTSDFRSSYEVLNQLLKDCPKLDGKTVLDCPLWVVKQLCPQKEYPQIHEAWDVYERALEKFGKTLCMSQRIMNMPTQHEFHTTELSAFKPPVCKPIFEFERFMPTGEHASTYQLHGDKTDTCAWRTIPPKDPLTLRFAKFSPWAERHMLAPWRKWRRGTKYSEPDGYSVLRYDTLLSMMDWISCLFASSSLAAAVFALAYVHSRLARLGAVAGFGLLFTLLMMVMVGNVRRGEVFLATAAFYAVAVVFVSNDNSCACSQ